MNIKSVGLNSVQNMSFGLLTASAEDRLYNNRFMSENEIKIAANLSVNDDFILHHDNKRNRFEIYATDYQTSYFFKDPKGKFPKIELMEVILDKMADMKKKFPSLPKREEKLSLSEFNG